MLFSTEGYPNAGEDVRELPGDGQPAEPVGAGAHARQGADHHGGEHQQDAVHVALQSDSQVGDVIDVA